MRELAKLTTVDAGPSQNVTFRPAVLLSLVRNGVRRLIGDPTDELGPAPEQVKPPVQSAKLTKLGRFRRDFWAHVSRRHPGEAPPGWASGNVYRRVDAAGRRVSQYVARDGVGVFFPRKTGESAAARTAAVRSSVRWLRGEIRDAQMTESGWSFLKINSRDRRNWDRMADWLHNRRLLYERALRAAGRTRFTPR